MHKRITFDLETYLIEPGQIVPKPVAGGMMAFDGTKMHGPFPVYLDQVVNEIRIAVEKGWLIVGHNVFFDLACAWRHDPTLGPTIWNALSRGLVSCTGVREKLIKNAEGRLDFDPYYFKQEPKFSLADLVGEYLGVDIKESKNNPDSWRLRYSELDNVLFEQWPQEAMEYMLSDVSYTDAVWLKQAKDRATQDGIQFVKGGRVTNEAEQCRAAWALHLITAWGMITDKDAVDALEIELLTEAAKHVEELKQLGLIKPKGGRLMKAIKARVEAAFAAQGLEVPKTDKGNIKTDEDTLKEANDPQLITLLEHTKITKLLDTFVRPVLRKGTHCSIHANYDVLKATGRTSSYGTGKGKGKEGHNVQQLPRKGGIRECFIPRPGYVFVDCDYSTIELAALAQVTYSWFGYSAMRDYLIKGYDLHLVMAAGLVGQTYEQMKEAYDNDDPHAIEMRQLAKVPNFGFPGGMGPETLVLFAHANYGLDIELPTAYKLREVWRQTFPEMTNYFAYFSQATDNPNHEFTLIQPISGRVRGGARYTSGANSCFQGPAADGAKEALFRLSYECYIDKDSALYGSRVVAFVHDECLAEVPDIPGTPHASHAADRLSQVMVDGMSDYLPDVPITAEPAMMRRWYKGAKPVRNEQGWLIPWEPKSDG